MPITILDMIVIGIVLLSGLLAALRGFTREILAIGSWAVAAAAAYALYPQVMPYAQQYIANRSIAIGVSAAAVFFVVLVIAYFITAKLSDMILDSRIGALDRTLGFIFGAARGLLLAVVAFLFFKWLVAEQQQPNWVREAKLRPLLESTGTALMSMLPADSEKLLEQLRRPRAPEGDTPQDTAPPPGTVPPQQRPATPGQQRT